MKQRTHRQLYEALWEEREAFREVIHLLITNTYGDLKTLIEQNPSLADSMTVLLDAEVRKALGAHPMGEPEAEMRELYRFFSEAAHPNRN